LLLIAILFASVGCQHTVYYHQRLPILERPERPELAPVPGSEMIRMTDAGQYTVKANFQDLMDYSRKLEVAIDTYNEYAKEQNAILNAIGEEDE
jgi:hypothetical protein